MTKEEQQLQIEEKRKLREKQMLQLKASNEMLEDAKAKIIEKYGEDSETTKKLLKDLQTAQDQNIEMAENYLNAKWSETEHMKYHEVDKGEADAYYQRLKNLGKSDEALHEKNLEKQMKLMEGSKAKQTVSQATKKQTKLTELTDKLKKLKSGNKMNVTPEPINEPIPEPINGPIVREPEENDDTFKTMDLIEQTSTKERITDANIYVAPVVNDELYPEFDPRDVPSYIQYDMIPLPSRGECYAHKKSKLPVAYLTAADENIITSRNLYNSGSMIDIILERKILDKSIRVADLCKGDRDAIAIWLRATAYGPDYPIVTKYKDEDIEAVIDLNDIEYLPFELKGDENGWFLYKTKNGDELKYKILSYKEEETVYKSYKNINELVNRNIAVENLKKTSEIINSFEEEDSKSDVIETVDYIKDWVISGYKENDIISAKNFKYSTLITDKMILQTMSVNGNTDREYIKNYIENMVAGEAYDYRNCMSKNIPGVNLEITVPIPESMGGGSFNTFLSLGETIFINV